MTTYRIGEIFSGPGGLALGASRASIEGPHGPVTMHHIWAIDNDADACATFLKNISPSDSPRVIQANIQDVDFAALEMIDGLAFGFPCNDFSVVGEQRGLGGTFGPLYSHGVRALKHFSPKWFLAENVGGLQSADDGLAFRKILDELRTAGIGYHLTTHYYHFEDYGVPQTRHRIIIVGIRQDAGIEFKVPAPTHARAPRTARQALLDPPIPSWALNQELTKQSQQVIERLNHIPPGGNAWSPSVPKSLRLNVKRARLSQIYKRLDPDRPSYTVTGSGGGGTHVYHWEEPRALTNRERARLQTFPDDFVFLGAKESVRKQIGMAVPPLAAQAILEALLKTLHGLPYPSLDPKWIEPLSDAQELQLRLLEHAEFSYGAD